MMASHMEKMLIAFEAAVSNEDIDGLVNLAAKSRILRRRDASSASVIREISNNEVYPS